MRADVYPFYVQVYITCIYSPTHVGKGKAKLNPLLHVHTLHTFL